MWWSMAGQEVRSSTCLHRCDTPHTVSCVSHPGATKSPVDLRPPHGHKLLVFHMGIIFFLFSKLFSTWAYFSKQNHHMGMGPGPSLRQKWRETARYRGHLGTWQLRLAGTPAGVVWSRTGWSGHTLTGPGLR